MRLPWLLPPMWAAWGSSHHYIAWDFSALLVLCWEHVLKFLTSSLEVHSGVPYCILLIVWGGKISCFCRLIGNYKTLPLKVITPYTNISLTTWDCRGNCKCLQQIQVEFYNCELFHLEHFTKYSIRKALKGNNYYIFSNLWKFSFLLKQQGQLQSFSSK